MSSILTVFSAIFWGLVTLSLLVFVHEGGHYLAARFSGMRVIEFFLGMVCSKNLSFVSKTRGTRFGVTPILIGGYTRVCGLETGETDLCARILAYIARRGKATLPELASAFNASEDDVQASLDVLVDWASIEEYAQEATDGEELLVYRTVQRDPELRCVYDKGHDFNLPGTTQAGEPHALIPLSARDASSPLDYSDACASAFFESERKQTYSGKSFLQRMIFLLAGPAVNVVLALITVSLVLSIGGIELSVNTSSIGSVSAGSYAEEVGLQAGDSITDVAGVATETWYDFTNALNTAISAGNSFDIAISRDGSEFVLTLDAARLESDGVLGVSPPKELYHPDILSSLGVAWQYAVTSVAYIAKLFIPTETAEIVSQSSSIVGISVMAAQAVESGISDYLYFVAAISLSLGLMNLIPIPPLDGGKILIELIGLLLGHSVSEKVQIGLSYLGLALCMLLFVTVLHQDIIRYVFGG